VLTCRHRHEAAPRARRNGPCADPRAVLHWFPSCAHAGATPTPA
jgi:hypothetical protein